MRHRVARVASRVRLRGNMRKSFGLREVLRPPVPDRRRTAARRKPYVCWRALQMPPNRNNPLGYDAVQKGVRPRSNGGQSPLGDLDLKDLKGEVNRE